MEPTQNRLVHEALQEPVKNAFRLGWEFVERNRTLALTTLAAFILLSLLELIPLIGLAAAVALGVFSQAVQIYVGRTLYGADSIEAFVGSAEQTTFGAFVTRYQAQAFGAWVGWFVLGMGVFALSMVLILVLGVDPAALEASVGDEAQFLALAGTIGIAALPILLVGMLVAYVYPIAQGKVILSENFGEAFRAVFSVFSPAVWKAAAGGAYFRFVLYLGFVLIGIAALVMIAAFILILIPFLGVILAPLMIVGLFYPLTMIMGIANVLALAIIEEA